jgi:hypothetical protein
LPEASAGAQQVCALCDQLGQSAWKSPVALREAMPARTFIRGNSGNSTCLKMNDSHESPAMHGQNTSASKIRLMKTAIGTSAFPVAACVGDGLPAAGLVEWLG